MIYIEEKIKQFGIKQQGVEYVPRPGVYAIMLNKQGELGVIEKKGKYYLVGGGLESEESEAEGLRRETLEEIGKEILSMEFLGRANQYTDSKKGYFNKIGSFYKVELDETKKEKNSEPDHLFKWVSKDLFRSNAAHEAQVWAVENLLR